MATPTLQEQIAEALRRLQMSSASARTIDNGGVANPRRQVTAPPITPVPVATTPTTPATPATPTTPGTPALPTGLDPATMAAIASLIAQYRQGANNVAGLYDVTNADYLNPANDFLAQMMKALGNSGFTPDQINSSPMLAEYVGGLNDLMGVSAQNEATDLSWFEKMMTNIAAAPPVPAIGGGGSGGGGGGGGRRGGRGGGGYRRYGGGGYRRYSGGGGWEDYGDDVKTEVTQTAKQKMAEYAPGFDDAVIAAAGGDPEKMELYQRIIEAGGGEPRRVNDLLSDWLPEAEEAFDTESQDLATKQMERRAQQQEVDTLLENVDRMKGDYGAALKEAQRNQYQSSLQEAAYKYLEGQARNGIDSDIRVSPGVDDVLSEILTSQVPGLDILTGSDDIIGGELYERMLTKLADEAANKVREQYSPEEAVARWQQELGKRGGKAAGKLFTPAADAQRRFEKRDQTDAEDAAMVRLWQEAMAAIAKKQRIGKEPTTVTRWNELGEPYTIPIEAATEEEQARARSQVLTKTDKKEVQELQDYIRDLQIVKDVAREYDPNKSPQITQRTVEDSSRTKENQYSPSTLVPEELQPEYVDPSTETPDSPVGMPGSFGTTRSGYKRDPKLQAKIAQQVLVRRQNPETDEGPTPWPENRKQYEDDPFPDMIKDIAARRQERNRIAAADDYLSQAKTKSTPKIKIDTPLNFEQDGGYLGKAETRQVFRTPSDPKPPKEYNPTSPTAGRKTKWTPPPAHNPSKKSKKVKVSNPSPKIKIKKLKTGKRKIRF